MKKIYKSLSFIGYKALKELLLTTSLGMTGSEGRDPLLKERAPCWFPACTTALGRALDDIRSR